MTILLLETLHNDAHELLSGYAPVVLAPSPDALPPTTLLAEAEAILTRGRGRVTAELLDAAPRLRVVARCGVGVDNIDVRAVQARHIPVVYAPGSTTYAVTEHTLLLMLALARRLPTLANATAAGDWAIRNGYSGVELMGKRLGIVGLGEIGRRVAGLAAAFGMEVVTWSRASRDPRYPAAATLSELLAQSDVISLHVALTPETHSLIGPKEIAQMRQGSLLINTARGGVVDPAAVLAGLESGRLGGYAADVLAQEPPAADDPLLSHPGALITPHVAALTDRTYRAMCVSTAQNVLAIVRGEAVDPAVLYPGS